MAKYLIVGGVAGGATAAARLRRLDEFAEIIMFEKVTRTCLFQTVVCLIIWVVTLSHWNN